MITIEEINKIVADNQGRAESNTIDLAPGQTKKVWFENEDLDEIKLSNDSKPYYLGHLSDIQGSHGVLSIAEGQNCRVVRYKKPKFTMDTSKIMEYSAKSEEGLEDMVEIDELNNATLLYNLFKRYEKDEIHTYVGPILLVMNPFKTIGGMYSEEKIARYATNILNAEFPSEVKREMDPHVFALTAISKKQMLESKKKQAIVISGESGAGKTESAKRAMKFLTQMNQYVDGMGGSHDNALDGIE
jgi:myosin heavy subunit